MLKKILITILIISLLLLVYCILARLGVVPMYHCDTAMGPHGLVQWCEWYAGSERVY